MYVMCVCQKRQCVQFHVDVFTELELMELSYRLTMYYGVPSGSIFGPLISLMASFATICAIPLCPCPNILDIVCIRMCIYGKNEAEF